MNPEDLTAPQHKAGRHIMQSIFSPAARGQRDGKRTRVRAAPVG